MSVDAVLRRTWIRDGAAAARGLDVARRAGPLASMHAALDQAGIGMPCGVAAYFPKRGVAQLEAALTQASHAFPALRSRLLWRGGRPVLTIEDSRPPAAGPWGVADLLGLSSRDDGSVWRYRLVEDGDGTWFIGAWVHAAADGLSMLRLAAALGSGTPPPASLDHTLPPASRRRPFATWLPGFLLDQSRAYVRMPTASARHPLGASWTVLSPESRNRLFEHAKSLGVGMGALLSAAAALAYRDQQIGDRQGRVRLNRTLSRRGAADRGGFGFGAGSILIALPLEAGLDLGALAKRIGAQTRDMAEAGWDQNLLCFLSDDPRRHLAFARIQAARPADPTLTVSWKGYHPDLGCGGGAEIACVAAAPTLHLSAHADRNGLSLSLTSPQPAAERMDLMQAIADRLGLGLQARLRELSGLLD